MREILFRGYSEDYGWIYGDYSEPNGVYPANIYPHEDSREWDAYEGIAVRPETVGQFTGMDDGCGNAARARRVSEGKSTGNVQKGG